MFAAFLATIPTLYTPILPWLIVQFIFIFIFVVERIGTIAPAYLGQLCLATDIGKAFDTVAVRVLHKVQLVVQKVVVFQRDRALLVYD